MSLASAKQTLSYVVKARMQVPAFAELPVSRAMHETGLQLLEMHQCFLLGAKGAHFTPQLLKMHQCFLLAAKGAHITP